VKSWENILLKDMALRIGKFAGNGPGLWLRMQQAYDLWYAEHRLKDDLSKIKTVSSVELR
jgi:plasmid maintenance system antidote protein VapI